MSDLSLYSVLLFLHVIGAMALFLVAGTVYISLLNIRRARTAGTLRLWATLAARTTRVVQPVAGLFILFAGIGMLIVSWHTTPPWAVAGLISLLVIGASTGAFFGRTFGIMTSQASSLPAEAPLPAQLAAAAISPRPWLIMNAVVGLLVGTVFLMTTKPDLLGTIIEPLVAVALGLAVGALTRGRQAEMGEAQPARAG